MFFHPCNTKSFFVLEIREMNGFYYINYACDRQKIITTAENVCKFKFEENPVSVFFGANLGKTVTFSEWKEECESHVKTFYSSHGKLSDVILIPGLTKQNEKLWQGVIDLRTFINWCNLSEDKLAVIIPDYNIVDHFNIYSIPEPLLREKLNIKNFQKSERLLIFNASCNAILIIRVASDRNLKNEISHCIDDVNLFLLMLRDELKESGILITGFVVYIGNNKHLENDSLACHDLIVPWEALDSEKSFDNYWQRYHGKSSLKNLQRKLPHREKQKIFIAVSGKLLAYLSQYQYKVCQKIILPTNQKDAAKNIVQTELLLDRYQMEIVHSKNNHILLKGDYGTGKSIICLKKLELLSKKLQDKEIIFYINFHKKSDFDFAVNTRIKNISSNINILGGTGYLSDIIKFGILETKEFSNMKKTHLIVDEFNTESLTTDETTTLKKLFTEEEQLRDSTILIALQPIEIERIDYHHVDGEERCTFIEGNMVGELQNFMRVEHLRHVMRTTIEINILIKITQEYLNEKSNQYLRHRQNNDGVLNPDSPIQDATFNTEVQFGWSYPQSSTSRDFKPQPRERIDYDKLHKLTFTDSMENIENFQKRTTTYRYYTGANIGHGISGPLPHLVKLPESANENELIGLFAIFIKKIISESGRIAVIHFEHENPMWLTSLFKLPITSQFVSIADNIGCFLSCTSEKIILVKNYNDVRGMEFSNVVILLDANEYHLKQFIPEAMARCQSNLSIVIKPNKNEERRDDAVLELVEYWEKANKQRNILKNLTLSFCSCISQVICNHEVDLENQFCHQKSENSYTVHKDTDAYKQLLKEIEEQVIPNIRQDNSDIKTKAINM